MVGLVARGSCGVLDWSVHTQGLDSPHSGLDQDAQMSSESRTALESQVAQIDRAFHWTATSEGVCSEAGHERIADRKLDYAEGPKAPPL